MSRSSCSVVASVIATHCLRRRRRHGCVRTRSGRQTAERRRRRVPLPATGSTRPPAASDRVAAARGAVRALRPLDPGPVRPRAGPVLCVRPVPDSDGGVAQGAYHLSRRKTQKLLSELFGITVCLGAISTMEKRASAALAAAHGEALREVQYAAVKHSDATRVRSRKYATAVPASARSLPRP